MCYDCGVLYAVLYFRVNCFVVRGCAVSRRYIHFCNSDVFSVVNMCARVCAWCEYMGGTRGSDILYSSDDVLEMSVVCVVRGLGGVMTCVCVGSRRCGS